MQFFKWGPGTRTPLPFPSKKDKRHQLGSSGVGLDAEGVLDLVEEAARGGRLRAHLSAKAFGELGDQLPLLVSQGSGNVDVDGHDLIAAIPAPHIRHTLVPQAELLSRL